MLGLPRTAVLAALLALFALPVAALAQAPVIDAASIQGSTLTITGSRFATRAAPKPRVTLNGVALADVSVNTEGTRIIAPVPELDPGSYTLLVARGAAKASSVVTTGAVGPEGPQGPIGPVGPQGPRGEQGTRGDQGPKGDRGDVGPKGDPGMKGDQGPKGDQGDIGPTGLQGPEGDVGPVGPLGLPGPQGETGPVGPQGPEGDPGAIGAQGPKGDTGAIGEAGVQGPAGPTGPPGPTGERGSPGHIDVRDALDQHVCYYMGENDCLSWDGEQWLSLPVTRSGFSKTTLTLNFFTDDCSGTPYMASIGTFVSGGCKFDSYGGRKSDSRQRS